MKKTKLILAALLSTAVLCSCGGGDGKQTPEATPTPEPVATASSETETAATPRPTATPVTGEVHYDSPIVGQWVPIGVDGSGYMLFTEDGKVIRYVAATQDIPATIDEWRYELIDEDTFTMINEENVYSDNFDFAVSDDNQTLTVYTNYSGYKMGSEFVRIPE